MSLEFRFEREGDGFAVDLRGVFPLKGVMALYGPSGSGKTTLLRLLAGLDVVDNGYLRFGDAIWQEGRVLVPTHERRVGLVFQDNALFPHLDVAGNLRYATRRSVEEPINFQHIVEILELGTLMNRDIGSLSGGEKQRVAIARAVCSNPKLLLLDEPLSALDTKSRRSILPLLETLKEELKVPMVYVSHQLSDLAQIADHLALIKRGTIYEAGNFTSIANQSVIKADDSNELGTMFEARALKFDLQHKLICLDTDIGELLLPSENPSSREKMRIFVRAKDVSITLRRQSDTSILNVLPGTISSISCAGGLYCRLEIDCHKGRLFSLITSRSVDSLGLHEGLEVFCQIKSMALI